MAEKSKGKRPFGRTGHRREDTIKIVVRRIGCELGQKRVKWETCVSIIINY
jgi:hypothetical protein